MTDTDVLAPTADAPTMTVKQTVMPPRANIPPREEQRARAAEAQQSGHLPPPVDPPAGIAQEPIDPLAAITRLLKDVASIKETTDWMRKRFG